jgi:PTH1 family peptidyl-tRNA hydrolase
MALQGYAKEKKLEEWKFDKKANALITRGVIGRTATILVLPETFMNKSGSAVARFVKNFKVAERLVVVYDDLDLPLGAMKISFDRGSGGHKGIESTIRSVKTTRFWRVRIGISPVTSSGTPKKPHGEKAVNDFILGTFTSQNLENVKKVFTRVSEALDCILSEGAVKAMNRFN